MEKDLYVIRGGRGGCEETVETVVVLSVNLPIRVSVLLELLQVS